MKSVNGTVTAQYTQNLFKTTASIVASHLNRGIAKSAATKVPGRKTTVTAASVVIDEESSLLEEARVLESSAMAMLTLAPCWAIRLKS